MGFRERVRIEESARGRVGVALLFLAAACASPGPDGAREDVAQSSAALAGGNNLPNNSPDANDAHSDVVVEFYETFTDSNGREEAICSGTMVTPTLILTANHCLTGGLLET